MTVHGLPTGYTPPRSKVLAASCDKHLPSLILGTLPGPEAPAADVRVTELREPDPLMKCSCGVPAQWKVRSLEGGSA